MKAVAKKEGWGLMPGMKSWLDDFWGSDRFFDDDFFTARSRWLPAVNIKDVNGSFEIEVAAPGLRKEDFNVAVENGLLKISCEKEEKKEEKEDNYTRREFSYRSFNRSFAIPENTDPDSIEAKYEDGILKLRLKKMKMVEPEAKKILIS
ncbi:MAG: Hsp20/alpha crystallin family protein [Saprospiraceae bacterium]|nr:Hsp20/alpha crystallin family protein [Saprospiraceae bacterium]